MQRKRILMLGWEFPPLVSGGLATATEGLVSGLVELGCDVSLVLPYYPLRSGPAHPGLTIVSPEQESLLKKCSMDFEEQGPPLGAGSPQPSPSLSPWAQGVPSLRSSSSVSHSSFLSPSHYEFEQCFHLPDVRHLRVQHPLVESLRHRLRQRLHALGRPAVTDWSAGPLVLDRGDQTVLLGVLALEALDVLGEFDAIHAHDWMSVNALMLLRSVCQIPIVFHIHSTEVDRGGPFANPQITALESLGMHLADAVVTVSEFTKQILMRSYGVPEHKIHVVYNAANVQHHVAIPARPVVNEESPRICFVGRLTFQKGPSYFVQAARQVLKAYPQACFDVVGTGDLWDSMRQYVWELGLNDRFCFHGFLASAGVERILSQSDVFVMPSVSEPFGIVALEAIQRGVPVVLSKQSGVSEVVHHALKVDHWDVDLMTDRIVSLLRYPALRQTVIEHALVDLQGRSWLRSAQACLSLYQSFQNFMPRSEPPYGRTVSLL